MERLHEFLNVFSGSIFLINVALTGLLILILPRPQRRQVMGQGILLVCYVLLSLLQLVLPSVFLENCALFCLLSALGFTLLLFFQTQVLQRLGKRLPRIGLDILHLVILSGVLIIVLHRAGVDPTALITGSAVLTAVIGIALRDTLANLIAGLTFQLQPPFEIGDWIQFDNTAQNIGEVTEMNWRATRIVTIEKVEVVLPNGPLAQAHIRNYTKPQRWSRRSAYVVAPFATPPNRVRQIILDAIRGCWGVCTQPPPSVVTSAFTERGVEYWIRFFTEEFGSRDAVDSGVRDRIWYAFAREGIAIPTATHSVMMTQLPPPPVPTDQELVARRKLLLAAVPIFTVLPDSALSQLAVNSREELYSQGEDVIRQGERTHAMYLMEQGEVVVTARHGEGSPVEIARLGKGSVFGEMSLLTGETRSATVTAVAECRLLVVDKSALEPVLRQCPDVAERISNVLVEKQKVLQNRLNENPGMPKQESQGNVFERIREFFDF